MNQGAQQAAGMTMRERASLEMALKQPESKRADLHNTLLVLTQSISGG